MFIEVLKSKLHMVTVTEANLNYMGSITIDEDLMDAAGLIAGEKVQVVDRCRWWTTTTASVSRRMSFGASAVRAASASTELRPARSWWATRSSSCRMP